MIPFSLPLIYFQPAGEQRQGNLGGIEVYPRPIPASPAPNKHRIYLLLPFLRAVGMPKTEDISTPAGKRRRLDDDEGPEGKNDVVLHVPNTDIAILPELPSTVWAEVVDFLEFEEALKCCAVSKLFLKEIIPQIKEIVILSDKEMRSAFARRFSGLESVVITCLFEHYEGERDPFFCSNTLILVPPFLAHFPDLEVVELEGQKFSREDDSDDTDDKDSADDYDGAWVGEPASFFDCMSARQLTQSSASTMGTLVSSICGLYLCGSIPEETIFVGLIDHRICWGLDPHAHDNDCTQCCQVCECFRIKSIKDALAGNVYDWRETDINEERAICLSAEEAIKIVISRSGGKEAIDDPKFLMDSLANKKYEVAVALAYQS